MRVAKDIYNNEIENGLYRFHFKSGVKYVGCIYDHHDHKFITLTTGTVNKLSCYRHDIEYIELIATE